ncbi:MAG: hypothetical protein RIB60_07050 [Phycisphaerales bacterium]
MRDTWTIDELGHVRAGAEDDLSLAAGWVDTGSQTGAIERLNGEPAVSDRLPTEVLDVLERRYPGTRWFVATGHDGDEAAAPRRPGGDARVG